MPTPSSPPERSGGAPASAPAPEQATATPPRVWQQSSDGAVLIGWACRECGHRGLPRQDFGCERCGAPREAIAETEFPARGVLRSSAVVERHAVWPVPFTLGEVQLDSGPVLHAFLAPQVSWEPGTRVAGDADDASRLPYLVFTAEEQHGSRH